MNMNFHQILIGQTSVEADEHFYADALVFLKAETNIPWYNSWMTRWWFQKVFYFHPYLGKMIQFD